MGRSTYDNGHAERGDKRKDYQEINHKIICIPILAVFCVVVAVVAATLNTAAEQANYFDKFIVIKFIEMHIQHNEYWHLAKFAAKNRAEKAKNRMATTEKLGCERKLFVVLNLELLWVLLYSKVYLERHKIHADNDSAPAARPATTSGTGWQARKTKKDTYTRFRWETMIEDSRTLFKALQEFILHFVYGDTAQ